MASAPDDEENELNFSDIDSDDDNENEKNRPLIAHKDMSSFVNVPSGGKEVNKHQVDPGEDYEPISPPAQQEKTDADQKHVAKDGEEQDNFDPISPVSEPGDQFEAISPPASPKDSDKLKFENISDDEEEQKKEETLPEGKFSPVQESDNELNFDDENSNDSGYQIVKPAEPKTEGSKIEGDTNSELPKEDGDEDDIEAPMPSPFSDIGDVDDIPGTDGAIINDILKDSNEQQFEVPAGDENKDSKNSEIASNAKETVASFEKVDDEPVHNVEHDSEKMEGDQSQEQSNSKQDETPESAPKTDKPTEGGEDDEDAGDLIADIFGDSDEEEEFEGFSDEEAAPEQSKESEASGKAKATSKEQDSSDDEEIPIRDFVSDFDLMLQKRKEMNRMKRRAKKDFDIINDNDDIIAAMIKQMNEAAQEDRILNQDGKAATKKLKMLDSVIRHLRKSDLQHTFIDCGILPALKEWLTPLPDHALPHINIRKTFLKLLIELPPLDKGALKVSGIGRAVMLLFKHPKETVENKRLAGKIISSWARPIFNVSSNFQDMSREEREHRDKSNLPEIKRRRLSSGAESNRHTLNDDSDNKPKKPGDKGWIGRARVPMPSHRDYVNRPRYEMQEFGSRETKKELNRYEKHMRKLKDNKTFSGNRKAVGVSLNGSKLSL